MKSLVVFLLSFSVLMSTLSQTILYVHYSLRYDYYSTVLCVNKHRPMLHCNGKCHLKKEMQQDEQKKNTPAENMKVAHHISLFSEPLADFKNYLPLQEQVFLHPNSDNLSAGYFLLVFRPPAC